MALVMLGAADALRRGDHISVDLITSRLTKRGKRLVEIWGYVVVLVFSSVLLISSKQTIDYSINFEIVSEGYLEVPMWIPQSFLILGGSAVEALITRLLREAVLKAEGRAAKAAAPRCMVALVALVRGSWQRRVFSSSSFFVFCFSCFACLFVWL